MQHDHRLALALVQVVQAQPAAIKKVVREGIQRRRNARAIRHVRPYQVTPATVQFSPLPMPPSTMWSPGDTRSASTALARTMGTDAGPTLPSSG